MRRYIDAESLLTKIKAYRPYMYLGEDALSYAIKMVELEPSADVRENVRGEWLHISDGYCDFLKCSQCGKTTDSRSNFCPNCGAQMIGDKE